MLGTVGPAEDRGDSDVLRLKHVVVRQGEHVTLSVDELTVDPGEVVALVGPNGAGKSTLLQVAALLRRPDQGEVRIGGFRVTRRSSGALRRRMAMVFQAPLLFDVDVLTNAASGLRFHGVGRRAAEDRARDWLASFGVVHLARRSPRTLSAGEAQRVSLARAFAVEPDILLLDEPFAALDSPTRAALVPELARHLRESGTAAIVVTHDQEEALALGDRLGVMLGGRIVQCGLPSNVVACPATAEVARFLGVANVFSGRVNLIGCDRAIVQLSDGESRNTVCVAAMGPIAAGQPVDVALPAEMVDVLPDGATAPDGWNAVAGTVVQTAPTPGGLRITVDCGVLIRAAIPRIAGRPGVSLGQSVRVAFSPESVHLMARDDHDEIAGSSTGPGPPARFA